MAEAFEALLRANLAASVAILVVMVLRRPLRLKFGAEVGYGVWLLPVLAACASFLPARTRLVEDASQVATLQGAGLNWLPVQDAAGAAALVWLAGAALMAGTLAWSQLRFLRRARLGLEGPALVGVIHPKLVIPGDYEARFTADERTIIRTHERMHVERGDVVANLLITAVQTICWFNPLVHWAGRLARQDQELACDAGVIARHPGVRRRYAETLLKTQLAPAPLPVGCHWPAPGLHPLEERIGLLQQPTPRARRHFVGSLSILLLAMSAGAGTWMARPVELVQAVIEAPAPDQEPMLFLIYRQRSPVSP